MLVVTVALAGTAFALVGTVTALWQLYLFVGILGGIGMSSFYLLTAATVAHWFDERRGLALALVLVGFNLGYISAGPAGRLADRARGLARGLCAPRRRLRRAHAAGRADRAAAARRRRARPRDACRAEPRPARAPGVTLRRGAGRSAPVVPERLVAPAGRRSP